MVPAVKVALGQTIPDRRQRRERLRVIEAMRDRTMLVQLSENVVYWTDLLEIASFAGICRHSEDAFFAVAP